MIAERRATMPQEPGRDLGKRPTPAAIRRVLIGKKLTVREIAAELRTTPRQVQQVVCNLIYVNAGWIARTRPFRGQYVYFLTSDQG